MEFEWDDAKAPLNLARHRIDFLDAIEVFLDPFRLELEDDRAEYGELRLKTRSLELRYRDSGRGFSRNNLEVEFRLDRGRRGKWRYGARDRRNLGGTFRTLDGARGDRRFAVRPWEQAVG